MSANTFSTVYISMRYKIIINRYPFDRDGMNGRESGIEFCVQAFADESDKKHVLSPEYRYLDAGKAADKAGELLALMERRANAGD